jgi:transcriptional regulator with XRE-family HTH domain
VPEDIQRRQLAEFLKRCRARLEPADVGLPDSRRRRTPGLRREDVAALAGVSVTWYTWLEQGRDIRASADVLERISSTLQMSHDEREYLFALVQHRPAPIAPDEEESVEGEVIRMIDALNMPALVMTWRWDVIAWNELAAAVFRDYSKLEGKQRNLLRHLLTDPRYRADPAEHEAIVSRVLAKFRVDYSQAADDPQMNALVEELAASCPIFDEHWMRGEVVNRSHGINVTRHPQLGGLTFEHSSYVPEGSPKLRLLFFAPYDASTVVKLAKLSRELQSQSKGRSLN